MSAPKYTPSVEWCAGLFEGEGWVCLHKRQRPTGKPRADVMAGITNTDVLLLQPFLDRWGGRMRSVKGTALSRKPVFEWRLECRKAEAFLRAIFPFLAGQKRSTVATMLAHRDATNARVRERAVNGTFRPEALQ